MQEVVTVEPVAVKRQTAARMLDCGVTKIWQLVKEGKLQTIKVGADTRVTVSSIKALASPKA